MKRKGLMQKEYFPNEILKNRSLCHFDQVFALEEKELD